MSPAGSLPRTGISFGTLRSAVEYGLPFLPFTETVTAAEVPQSGSEWVEPSPWRARNYMNKGALSTGAPTYTVD